MRRRPEGRRRLPRSTLMEAVKQACPYGDTTIYLGPEFEKRAAIFAALIQATANCLIHTPKPLLRASPNWSVFFGRKNHVEHSFQIWPTRTPVESSACRRVCNPHDDARSNRGQRLWSYVQEAQCLVCRASLYDGV
jgi:hypothetical protein